MSGSWDIHPNGVRSVVGRTKAKAEAFDHQMKPLEAALRGAAEQSSSPIVDKAVADLANMLEGQIKFVFTRTAAVINAAVQATNWYMAGDLEFAARAQAAASAAPVPQLPGANTGAPR